MRTLSLILALLSFTASAASKQAIVCSGTSLTFGYSQDATPYPVRLATAEGRPVANLGVGSARLAAIILRWQLYAKPFPYKTLVAEGGTNDLALDSTPAATLWPVFQAWIEEAVAAGQQVVAVSIPPRWGSSSWDGTKEAERLSFNASLSAYVAAHPAILFVDMDVLVGDDGALPDGGVGNIALRAGVDYGDHLHLNGTGMQDLADYIAGLL